MEWKWQQHHLPYRISSTCQPSLWSMCKVKTRSHRRPRARKRTPESRQHSIYCQEDATPSLDTNNFKALVSVQPPTPALHGPRQETPSPSSQVRPLLQGGSSTWLTVQNALCHQGPQHEVGWTAASPACVGQGALPWGRRRAMTRWEAGVQLLFSPPRSRSCTGGGESAQ